jgi:hypothetical protein
MIEDFPYYDVISNDTERLSKFTNLCNFDIPFTKIQIDYNINLPIKTAKVHFMYKNKGIYLFERTLKLYSTIMSLSELFLDTCKAHCNVKGFLSPYEYYTKNKNNIILNMKKKAVDINPSNIRFFIYENNLECSPHNPAIIKKFIELFQAKKILDMSAGWGDRLLGCMASKLKNGSVSHYTATDPNLCLHKYYDNMINSLLHYTKNKNMNINIMKTGFEKCIIEENFYDLAYSSPPYFDLEIYSNNEDQSIKNYTNESSWFEHFLKVCIIKIINSLVDGGYMVLYIMQKSDRNYLEKMFDWIKYINNVYYYGCIFYGAIDRFNLFKAHPMFIYKKSSIVPERLYNPKPKIYKKLFNIILDNNIIGGTFTRYLFDVITEILQNKSNLTLTYTISNLISSKYMCISIAYCMYLLKKKDIILNIIINDDTVHNLENIKKLCLYYYNNINFLTSSNNQDKNSLDINYIINSNSISHKQILIKKISKYNIFNKVKNLWIVVDDIFIIEVMLQIFKNATINCINLNKNLNISYNEKINMINHNHDIVKQNNNIFPENISDDYDTIMLNYLDVSKLGKHDYIWVTYGNIKNYI